MKKNKQTKVRLSGSDLSLKIVAITVTVISLLLIMFPFVLTISNAMKDNTKIYDVPPKLLPDAANSMSVAVDYTCFQGTPEELLAQMQDDMVSTMFGTYTILNRESIFEIKFYGTQDGKTIFYGRAHQAQLQLEKDYGIYEGTVLKNQTLLYKDRGERAAQTIGYEYDPNGLTRRNAPQELQENAVTLLEQVFEKKFKLHGEISAATTAKHNSLLFESFAHYMKLPNYMYSRNETVAKYGFMTFVMNTVIVIGFAIISQVLL